MTRIKELTEKDFEALLTKASQPLQGKPQGRIPDSKEVQTSESQTSDDCTENHTHLDNPVGT